MIIIANNKITIINREVSRLSKDIDRRGVTLFNADNALVFENDIEGTDIGIQDNAGFKNQFFNNNIKLAENPKLNRKQRRKRKLGS